MTDMNQEQQCAACGIWIGEGYIETIPYLIGGYTLCGFCKHILDEYGKIQLGNKTSILYDLYPDGSVKKRKKICMKIIFENNDLLPMSEAARALDITSMTLHRWIEAEKIMAVKIGKYRYIPKTEVERLKNTK